MATDLISNVDVSVLD